MTIHLNGASNPLTLKYNNTSLDYAYATVGGVQSVYPVWERDAAFPASLGSVVSVTYANGVTAYYRDMTFTSSTIYSSDGKHRARYDGSVTLEVPFASGKQVGASPSSNYPQKWLAASSSISSVSGIPSGYRFYEGGSPDDGTTIAYDVYQVSDGVLRPESKVAMNLQSYCSIDDGGYMWITTYLPGNDWPVFTKSGGWIYQGSGRLLIMRS